MSRPGLSVRASYRLPGSFPLHVVISQSLWLGCLASSTPFHFLLGHRAQSLLILLTLRPIWFNLVALDLHARRPPIGALTVRCATCLSSLFTFVVARDPLDNCRYHLHTTFLHAFPLSIRRRRLLDMALLAPFDAFLTWFVPSVIFYL